MKKVYLLILLGVATSFLNLSYSQDQKEGKSFGIAFSGFVKNDVFFDSRQTVSARLGHFLMYPQPIALDRDGIDINDRSNLNILAIQSRLTGKITGPDAFGARTSGVLEGAFFGHSNGDINGYRLRHAYVKLNWEKTELLAGQFWHPMFVTSTFPGTISFNTGVPFQPFSRNPQVRLTRQVGKFKLMAAILEQVDFSSPGGAETLRNSHIPDMQLQLHYEHKDAKSELITGIGAGYKILNPRLVTDSSYAANEKVKSLSLLSFIKYKTKPFTLKGEVSWGQNMFDLLMLGGYASSLNLSDAQLQRGIKGYETMDVVSFWTDLHTNNQKFQLGLFSGYTENLGAKAAINNLDLYMRGNDVKYIYRISPRAIWRSGKTQFALELEHTTAAYTKKDHSGKPLIDDYGRITATEEVANFRALLAVFYFF